MVKLLQEGVTREIFQNLAPRTIYIF